MNQNFLKFGFCVAIFSLLFLFSCKDACKNVTCVHGTCEDGTCVCDEGFTGTDCSTPDCPVPCAHGTCTGTSCSCDFGWQGAACDEIAASAWTGTFLADDNCLADYTISISLDVGINSILIQNVYNAGETLSASVIGNSGEIPGQTLGPYYYSGTLDISNDFSQITIFYYVMDTAMVSRNCMAILTRL